MRGHKERVNSLNRKDQQTNNEFDVDDERDRKRKDRDRYGSKSPPRRSPPRRERPPPIDFYEEPPRKPNRKPSQRPPPLPSDSEDSFRSNTSKKVNKFFF